MAQLVEELRYKLEGRRFDGMLGSTLPLTEKSSKNTSCSVKSAGAYGWQTYRLHVTIVYKSGSLNLLEPSGPAQACTGIGL